jgi:hypothetical protein
MNHETIADEIIKNILLKASCWRQEAKRFAGRPAEAKVCLEHVQDAETLAELERPRKLDEIIGSVASVLMAGRRNQTRPRPEVRRRASEF